VAWRDNTRSLRQRAAFNYIGVLVGDDDPTGSEGLAVSCNFFSVDGLDHATLGRLIAGDDCNAKGQIPVAVISESLWRNRFGADPRVINRVAQINYRPVIVIGVVPDRTAGWAQPRNLKVWMPYTALSYFDPSRDFAGRISMALASRPAGAGILALRRADRTERSG
jgi:putative ABC transport system permease protein